MESLASALKLLHLLAAVVMFGAGLTTAFFMLQADRAGDAAHMAATARAVVRAERLLIVPAVLLLLLSGMSLAELRGLPRDTPWLVASVVVFSLVGLIWLPVMWLQGRAARLAEACAAQGQPLPARFRRYMIWWYRLRWPESLGALLIFALMVFQPQW
ncbi:DUF2269 family protein [Alkalilimnicola sp. S0819]|uniref:DUF2269 family protein n=1 Tax=Alkalilimnicola sp. S0819 TaxID=2613922 RepID=UPI001D032CAD|nr:DUF2269 family protein [Alkalilimnicola sp. S0819]